MKTETEITMEQFEKGVCECCGRERTDIILEPTDVPAMSIRLCSMCFLLDHGLGVGVDCCAREVSE